MKKEGATEEYTEERHSNQGDQKLQQGRPSGKLLMGVVGARAASDNNFASSGPRKSRLGRRGLGPTGLDSVDG